MENRTSSGSKPIVAVGYARYSTQKQDGGVTIESQEREMKRLAALKGWPYDRTFKDEAVSGAVPPLERPGLCELMDMAKAGKFSIVLTLDASRLARHQRIFWDVIDDLKGLGVKVVTCVMADIDSFRPEFDMVAGSLQGAASYERSLVSLKTKLAHAELDKQGKAHGRPRLGFRINDKGYFEPDGVGGEGLELLDADPKLKASTLARTLGLDYQDGWALLKNLKLYLEESQRSAASPR